MKVLSIDFDYFQQVTEEQVSSLYPDGIDNPTELSELIWGDHYASHEEELKAIGIMQDELDSLEKLLLEQDTSCSVMIANSHRHIYDFILENRDDEKIGLVNIDMHHDMMNDNPNLDCGNWIKHLLNEETERGNKVNLAWIANPISLETYGLEKIFGGEDKRFRGLVQNSIESIKDESFDIIFLCRSDTWTPPHLDKYFTEICDLMKDHFESIKIEKGIDKPRTQYQRYAEEYRAMINKFKHEQRKDAIEK